MSVTYKNPPLVELIAEVRWGPVGDTAAMGPKSLRISLPHPLDEDIFMHYGVVIAQKGYGRFERLIPPGTPVPMTTAACRFRPTDTTQQSPLFQVGKGVFTANALPPNYQDWDTFKPVVRLGLESLFEAYTRAGQPAPQISEVLLRYINVFSSELTGGRELTEFLAEVMGIKLSVPTSISSLTKAGTSVQQVIQLEQQIDLGLLSLTIGPAVKANETAVLLDTSILVQREIGADIDAALNALTEARQVNHELFRALAKPLHNLMGPTS